MADTYAVLGWADDLDGPVVLYEGYSYSECDAWRYTYTRWGDWGGYDALSLYEVGPDQTSDQIHNLDMPIDTWERESA